MNEEKEQSVLVQILSRGYERIFFENWPMWMGGILIGIMSIITFAWARPWGVAGGLRNWGDWFFAAVGLYSLSKIFLCVQVLSSHVSFLTKSKHLGTKGFIRNEQFGLSLS